MPDGSSIDPRLADDPLAIHRDRLLDACAAAVQPNAPVSALKRVLAAVWPMLPAQDRHAFVNKLGEDARLIAHQIRWPVEGTDDIAEDPQLERLARDWPYVASILDGRDLEFAKSVQKRIRFNKKPTDKQRQWMVKLHKEWLMWRSVEDGGVVE